MKDHKFGRCGPTCTGPPDLWDSCVDDEKPPDMRDQLRFLTDRLKKLEVATGNLNGATTTKSTPADEVVDLESMSRTQLLEYAKNSNKTQENSQ